MRKVGNPHRVAHGEDHIRLTKELKKVSKAIADGTFEQTARDSLVRSWKRHIPDGDARLAGYLAAHAPTARHEDEDFAWSGV